MVEAERAATACEPPHGARRHLPWGGMAVVGPPFGGIRSIITENNGGAAADRVKRGTAPSEYNATE